jgi:hypothetical protein
MGTNQASVPAPATQDVQRVLLERYDQRIAYYWKANRASIPYFTPTFPAGLVPCL